MRIVCVADGAASVGRASNVTDRTGDPSPRRLLGVVTVMTFVPTRRSLNS